MAAEALLEVRGVHAGYGRYDVLLGVSLKVQQGEIVAIIGPNGAGKSTVLKTIYGFVRPRQGEVRFDGEDISREVPELMSRRGLAYVPQGRSVFPQMTVWENLELGAFIRRDRVEVRADMARLAQQFPMLQQERRRLAGALSGGQQQLLEMARGLMIKPKLMLLDEPSIGLSPKLVGMVFETIAELRALGTTILMVEQNARRALEIADRGYVLELGHNRFEGAGQDLLHRDDVKRLYLGGGQ